MSDPRATLKQEFEDGGRFGKAPVKTIVIGVVALIVLPVWPFYSVPTGSRGVVTQFGKIVGIESEGLAILPPWQKLSNFSIRAETATSRTPKAAPATPSR